MNGHAKSAVGEEDKIKCACLTSKMLLHSGCILPLNPEKLRIFTFLKQKTDKM